MKVLIVSGTRSELSREEFDFIADVILGCGCGLIMHGACGNDRIYDRATLRGVDACADIIGHAQGIPVLPRPARWKRRDGSTDYSAGPIRNRHMLELALKMLDFGDEIHLAAFPRGASPGTRSCIQQALDFRIPVSVYELKC